MNVKDQIKQRKIELDSLLYGYSQARTPLTVQTFDIIIRGVLVEIARLQRIESKQKKVRFV